MKEPTRCPWCLSHPAMIAYHDTEWGVPLHDDRKLYEFLVLDAAQAGLSWQTVLLKRDNYRLAFDGFDPVTIAQYTDKDLARLLTNPGIIRNRLKLQSAVANARAFRQVQAELGSFDRFIWQFIGGRPRVNQWRHPAEVPVRTVESDAMSKELKRRRFSFVGSTICYAFMQAAGLVNDHLVGCYRHAALSETRAAGRAAGLHPHGGA